MITIANPKHRYPDGIILYKGRSLSDEQPIVVIATGFKKTNNPKTGHMIQTWILPARFSPTMAYSKGVEESICGNCKHRGKFSGGWDTCYVEKYTAPYNVWHAWKRGKYEKPDQLNIHAFNNHHVRIGSYGDPAVVPFEVWDRIGQLCESHTGYTHQWNRSFCDDRLKNFCMASVDDLKEKRKAKEKGWRTFRIMIDVVTEQNEILCPGSNEAGNKLTCRQCGLCNGLLGGPRKMTDVAIPIHGKSWRVKRFKKIQELRAKKKRYSHLLGV